MTQLPINLCRQFYPILFQTCENEAELVAEDNVNGLIFVKLRRAIYVRKKAWLCNGSFLLDVSFQNGTDLASVDDGMLGPSWLKKSADSSTRFTPGVYSFWPYVDADQVPD